MLWELGPCGLSSVLGWEAPGAHSGHRPHLDSWHCLDLLWSLTCGHGPQTSAFTSWFLELLYQKWRGHLGGRLWHRLESSVLVKGVNPARSPSYGVAGPLWTPLYCPLFPWHGLVPPLWGPAGKLRTRPESEQKALRAPTCGVTCPGPSAGPRLGNAQCSPPPHIPPGLLTLTTEVGGRSTQYCFRVLRVHPLRI